MTPDEFRSVGHELVDRIAEFLSSISNRSVTPAETPSRVRTLLGSSSLPSSGLPANKLLREIGDIFIEHSLHNGHPKFWGYITSSAAPIGALADLLAASVNPNVGAFPLSPVATEIETQTVRWIAEMIGYPTNCGGLLVSGGNMANFVCFLAARRAKTPWDLRSRGVAGGKGLKLKVYCSTETHTWIKKAVDMFGMGTESISWIPADTQLRLEPSALREEILKDRSNGAFPFLVIGSAGTVSTGAIDPLRELAAICKESDLWFHVDGAYGGFAAALPDASPDLKALSEAHSVAVDPHKWLYSPLEAGCVLVRDKKALSDTFSFEVPYYRFEGETEEERTNFYELGPQNSRGFRALKVWLALRQAGRDGYIRMISDDIDLARKLFQAVQNYPNLQAYTHGLSITTFRYVPADLKTGSERVEAYLNDLNAKLLDAIQQSGKAYPSNAVINNTFVLRVCIVNFRTTLQDILEFPDLVTRIGAEIDAGMRPDELRVTR
jgi:aromatic-L-amino-acid decarboxylase